MVGSWSLYESPVTQHDSHAPQPEILAGTNLHESHECFTNVCIWLLVAFRWPQKCYLGGGVRELCEIVWDLAEAVQDKGQRSKDKSQI